MKEKLATVDLPDLLEAEVAVELLGEKFPVVYRVNAYTPAFVRTGQSISAALATLVSSWGLTKGGEPIPLTVEHLEEHVPLAVQRIVYNAIQDDFDPNLRLSAPSSGTS
jgi:hypothetical protein